MGIFNRKPLPPPPAVTAEQVELAVRRFMTGEFRTITANRDHPAWVHLHDKGINIGLDGDAATVPDVNVQRHRNLAASGTIWIGQSLSNGASVTITEDFRDYLNDFERSRTGAESA